MHIPIPVMFHSVGLNELAWASAHISEPLDYFVESMRLLQQQGEKTKVGQQLGHGENEMHFTIK